MQPLDYLVLSLCTIVPTIVTVLIYLLTKKWKWFKKRNYWIQQLLIAVVFSALTISSFYFGVDYQSIQTTGRSITVVGNFGVANAIPLISGLIFGGFSGFLSGLCGGIYRIFVYGFNNGDYLKLAECCTVFISGCLGWLIKKSLFDNKKPKWFYGVIIGLTIEVIHILFIFSVALIKQGSTYAYGIIRACDIACFVTVAVAVTLPLFAITLIERGKIFYNVSKDKRISTKISKWFLITFVIAIFFSFSFTYYGNMRRTLMDISSDLTSHNNDIKDQVIKSGIENIDLKGETTLDPKVIIDNKPTYFCTRFHRINKDGFCFLVDGRTHQILSIPDDLASTPEENDKLIGEFFTPNYDGEEREITYFTLDTPYEISFTDYESGKESIVYYVQFKHINNEANTQNFYIVSFISQIEARINMGMTTRLTEYLELLAFIAIFGVMYVFIKKVVIVNVHKINKSLDQITNGNLNVKVEVRSNQEFSDLSDDINQTVNTLKRFIEEANKRIDNELMYAKKIQQNALPIIFPTTNIYDLYATMHPAKQVGGDFYDFFNIDPNHLLFMIADVSGKGIPAAMFMMRAKTLIKSLAQTNELTLDHIVAGVNDELNADNDTGMFVTAWFGLLNINTGELDFVNAGHNRPILRRRGKFSFLTMKRNCVLGVMPNMSFELEKAKLYSNDIIYIYTDGVTEATSKKKELYGDDRLLDFVKKMKITSSQNALELLNKDVDKFQLGAEQADDITMMMLRYKPKDK